MTLIRHQDLVLAGDIGGTKTNLGLFFMGKRRPTAVLVETFPSREAPNLEYIIDLFLEKHQVSISSACFGIAGPVQNGRCKTTNLPWEVAETSIKRRFKWRHVRLINDLAATALSVPLLNSREVTSLNNIRSLSGQNIGLVAPGTGLGIALLIWAGKGYIPVPSEGGHVDFGPNNEPEVELWRHLRKRLGHVSIERIVSGPGLVDIYSWLKASGPYKEPAWLAKNMATADPARAITEAAMEKKQPLCKKALNLFISVFGAVAGNLALTGLTTGGIYLGGGISPKVLPKSNEHLFMKAFTNKGRFKGLLERMPVRLILNERAALIGAAHCAFRSDIRLLE